MSEAKAESEESIFILFARMPAVHVLPLLPPQPTSMRPSLGTLRCVRNLYSTEVGLTLCEDGERPRVAE